MPIIAIELGIMGFHKGQNLNLEFLVGHKTPRRQFTKFDFALTIEKNNSVMLWITPPDKVLDCQAPSIKMFYRTLRGE